MDNWKEIELEEYVEVNPRISLAKHTLATKVAMECVEPFSKKIARYEIDEYKGGVKFRNGDTIMARITPSLENGKTAKVDILKDDEIGFGSTEFIVLRAKDGKTDPDFVYYLAVSPELREVAIQSMTGSSGRQRVQTDVVKQFPFLFPPLPEQKAIAEVLSSLDDKIDLLHRQNKTLEAMAETLFRQWFVEPARRREIEGGEADESWEEVKLGQFVFTNSNSIGKSYNQSNIQYLDTGSLNEGNWSPLQHFNLSDAPSRAKRLTKHNNILYSTVRPNQLHYGLVRNPADNLVVSTGFCVIHCDTISTYFVYYLLIENGMVQYLHSIAEGSTSAYPSLKPSDLEAVEFLLPPEIELTKYHKIVDSYWDKIDYNYNQIQTLTNLRNTLLPKLMSGEVRVKMN